MWLSLARAPGLGPGSRRFESCHPEYYARVAQLVEYDLAKVGVAGSSPVSRSQTEYAAVAQSVERRIGSAEVTGPIPVSSLKSLDFLKGFFVVWISV